MDKPNYPNNKRYNTYNDFLRQRHGEKVGKLSLNAGLTCPNRDGTIGTGGCVFCSEDGSGTFAGCSDLSIKEQMATQTTIQSKKWEVKKYIAYFQSYSNTYGELENLRKLFYSALENPAVCGIAIATRPDCLQTEVLDLLSELNEKTHLWVELGLQTIHERTARWLNRGYKLDVFNDAVRRLGERNIEVVSHIIFGLPGETHEEMMETVKHVSKVGLKGVKIHLLHVIEGTQLNKIYEAEPFKILEQEEYIDLVVEALELLPHQMIIHRLTGDGAKETLVAPRWPLNKRAVLIGIDKALKERNTWQSKTFK